MLAGGGLSGLAAAVVGATPVEHRHGGLCDRQSNSAARAGQYSGSHPEQDGCWARWKPGSTHEELSSRGGRRHGGRTSTRCIWPVRQTGQRSTSARSLDGLAARDSRTGG